MMRLTSSQAIEFPALVAGVCITVKYPDHVSWTRETEKAFGGPLHVDAEQSLQKDAAGHRLPTCGIDAFDVPLSEDLASVAVDNTVSDRRYGWKEWDGHRKALCLSPRTSHLLCRRKSRILCCNPRVSWLGQKAEMHMAGYRILVLLPIALSPVSPLLWGRFRHVKPDLSRRSCSAYLP